MALTAICCAPQRLKHANKAKRGAAPGRPVCCTTSVVIVVMMMVVMVVVMARANPQYHPVMMMMMVVIVVMTATTNLHRNLGEFGLRRLIAFRVVGLQRG